MAGPPYCPSGTGSAQQYVAPLYVPLRYDRGAEGSVMRIVLAAGCATGVAWFAENIGSLAYQHYCPLAQYQQS